MPLCPAAVFQAAFLQWWIGTGPLPRIPGMQFDSQARSRYVLAVMNHANPRHGLAVGDKAWRRHVAAMPHAAAIVLQRLRPAE